MPNLLRMPVFYLGLVLLTFLGWLVVRDTGVNRIEVEATSDKTTTKAPASSSSPEAAEAPPSFVPMADDPILRTPNGLRRKVVVTDLGVRPRSEPVAGVFVGPALDYFGLFFLLSDPPAGSDRVQIGERDGKPVGWVPATSVLEWDSRLMAVPSSVPNRPRLRLFQESACLLDDLAGRTCSKHGKNCPISGEEPDGVANGTTASLGWPILESRSIPEPDGSTRTILKVACLVKDEAPIVEPSKPPPELAPLLKELDLAFVIDTTASMQNTIDAVKILAKDLVDSTRRRYAGMRLRLALVEYRDRSTAYAFETRRTIDFSDPGSFEAALSQVSAAEHGDGSVEEAVLSGVRAALPHEAGDDPTRASLSWPEGRAGELATKMIVLLGDAPDHASDPRLAIELAARAKRQRITIASVAIPKPGVLKGAELDHYRELWHTLADQSYRPADPSQGFATAIPPLEWTISDRADEGVARLQSLVDDRVAHARALAALAQAEAEGRLQEYTNSQGLRMDQVAPVLADLHRGEAQPGPRRDRRLEGKVAPDVRVGWIAETQHGQNLVNLAVLMSRTELDAVIGQLIQVQQGLESQQSTVADLLRVETDALAGEGQDHPTNASNESLGIELTRRAGLPPPPDGSLLRRSRRELMQADDLFRASLGRRLQSAIDALLQHRSDAIWSDPQGLNKAMKLIPYSDFNI